MTQSTPGLLERFQNLIDASKTFTAELEAAFGSMNSIATDLEKHVQHAESQKGIVIANAKTIITAVEQEMQEKVDGLSHGNSIIGGMLDYMHGVEAPATEAPAQPEAKPIEMEQAA